MHSFSFTFTIFGTVTINFLAAAKIGVLFMRNEWPHRVLASFLFLTNQLADVNPMTCDNSPKPAGRNACYLVDSNERDENLAAVERLAQFEKDHIKQNFQLLKNSEGKFPLSKLSRAVLGKEVPANLAQLTEEEFKSLVGGVVRSAEEDPLDSDDIRPVFDALDEDGK